jgi:heterodisulfide reductase subunit B
MKERASEREFSMILQKLVKKVKITLPKFECILFFTSYSLNPHKAFKTNGNNFMPYRLSIIIKDIQFFLRNLFSPSHSLKSFTG